MPKFCAVIHVDPNKVHHVSAADHLRKGLAKHGFRVEIQPFNQPRYADLVAVWSWRQTAVIQFCLTNRIPLLVMERGHLPPRKGWISCGFNGILREGIYPPPKDDGERLFKHFIHNVKKWKPRKGNSCLVIDQVSGIGSVSGPFSHQWTQKVIDNLLMQGCNIIYRRHPKAAEFDDLWVPRDVPISLRVGPESYSF